MCNYSITVHGVENKWEPMLEWNYTPEGERCSLLLFLFRSFNSRENTSLTIKGKWYESNVRFPVCRVLPGWAGPGVWWRPQRWRLLGQLQLWSHKCRAQECQVCSILLKRGIAQNGPQRCRWRLLGQLELWSHQRRAQECQVRTSILLRRGLANGPQRCWWRLLGQLQLWSHQCWAQECQVCSILLRRGKAQNGPQRRRLLGQLQLWSHQCRAQECQVRTSILLRREAWRRMASEWCTTVWGSNPCPVPPLRTHNSEESL